MIERIIYDRDDKLVELHKVGAGASFIWDGEYVCKRLNLNGSYDIYDMQQHRLSEGIPAIVVSSGELAVFSRDTLVEPIQVEHHVVG